MTEIENVLNGLPYDFLIRNPDESYKDLKLVIELNVQLFEGTIAKYCLLQKNNEFYFCTWLFNFLTGREEFVEFVPITEEEALNYCNNKIIQFKEAADVIRNS